MTREIRTTCNRDCPDSCGIVATVDDGRIVSHKGDRDHGVTRGFLCYKGNHYLERLYSKDRILHPQRRSDRGWERITWDEALDLTAEKLADFRDSHGARSILYVNYSGIKGQVARLMARKFWAHFGGATFLKGGTSVEASHAAQGADFGGPCTHAPEDLARSGAIVVWGKNLAVTRIHCMPYVKEARSRGARLIVIDPVTSATARIADEHLPLRPGSDHLLAMGVARLLIEKGAIDEGFIDRHSNGFDDYRGRIVAVAMDDVARGTDLSMAQIEELARIYAATKPLATMIGLGTSYWRNSGETVRLIDALVAMTGNIGVSGGGAHTDINGAESLDRSAFDEPPDAENRYLLLPRLGEEIVAAEDPPLKMGFVAGANPAATCPDTGRVCAGLDRLEFSVVIDQFMTATAERTDLFLPCTTYLEMDDLVAAYGHHWLGLTQQVVPPLGEARSDSAIFQALAERLGFGEHLAGAPAVWIDRLLAPLEAHGISREALSRAPALNPLAPHVAFADRRFATPSGKYEFIRSFNRSIEEGDQKSLRLMATKTLKMVNAQINDSDLIGEPVVRVHPDTARDQGIGNGDEVVVESSVGSVKARLASDPAVRRDLLLFNPAAWRGDLQGVNQLREAAVCDMGDAAAMHETRVTVRQA